MNPGNNRNLYPYYWATSQRNVCYISGDILELCSKTDICVLKISQGSNFDVEDCHGT